MCLVVPGGGVSENPLSGVTSVIQFDDVMAIVVLCPCTGRGRAQKGTMDTANTFVQSESRFGPHSNNVSL